MISEPLALSRIRKLYPELLSRLLPLSPRSPDLISPVITPVVLLEDLTTIAITASVLGDGWFTAGLLTAAAAGTVHADTGALTAGNYLIRWHIYREAAVGGLNTFEIQHRNAADNATLNSERFTTDAVAGEREKRGELVINVAEGERVRIVNQELFGAGIDSQASMWVQTLT